MFERFFVNDDGTLLDRTIPWSNSFTESGGWDCKSYLYVSSYLPFNHKYFDIETPNDQDGTLSVEIWYNSEWVSVVDILDYTNDGTRPLSTSGNILFTPDDEKGWELEDDSSDITELTSTKIYNVYWMRFGFNSALDSSLVINYIGNKFCDDNGLFAYYPLLANTGLMERFATGKTDWTTQEIAASNAIISDLRGRSLIISKDQILDSKRFEVPCIHKTAEMIFSGLGSAYSDNMIQANKAYHDSMNKDDFGIDQNMNGAYERGEKVSYIKRLGR